VLLNKAEDSKQKEERKEKRGNREREIKKRKRGEVRPVEGTRTSPGERLRHGQGSVYGAFRIC